MLFRSLPPELMPEAPFAPFVLTANNVSGLYRTNGTSWTFDAQGMVVSTDALFWGGVGGSGVRWFPVAPGITTLPTTPPVVDGQMTVLQVVPVANETVLISATLRLRPTVESYPFAMQSIAQLIFTTRLRATVQAFSLVTIPAATVDVTGLLPTVNIGARVLIPAAVIEVASLAPVVQTVLLVELPLAVIEVVGLTPSNVGGPGVQVGVPAAVVETAALMPTVEAGDEYWSSWTQQNYVWWAESYPEWWAN